MPTLTPAAELARAVSRPFPNEPEGYRAAREALMAEEIELHRHLAAVAEERRALPVGGEVPDGGRVRLIEPTPNLSVGAELLPYNSRHGI